MTATTTYDAYGNPHTISRTDGGTVTNTWNVRGDLLVARDANGNPTTSNYNNRRLLVTVTDTLDNTVSNTWNDAGLKTKVTDPLGRETVTEWTPTYKVAKVTFPDASFTENHYDSRDWLVGTTDARGHSVSNVLDSAGRKVAVIDRLGNTTHYVHDANGNVVAQTNTLGKTTTFVYDKLNRIVQTIDPLSHSVSNTFDKAGRLVAVTDAKGYTTQYEFDAAGRKVAEIKPDGVRESYTLDPNGNMTAFENGLGKTRTFAFDGMNRVTNETDAVGNSRGFVFDAAGNLLERHDADGATIEYEHDDLNRVVGITYPDTTTVTYAYNEVGLRTYQSNAVAEVWYGYSNMDRLSVVTQSVAGVQSVVSYFHDSNGNRTNLVYPGSVAVGYTFDDTDRLTHVNDWGGRTTAYTYDDLHRKTGVDYPTAASGTWTWDDASRLTRIQYHNGTSNFVDRVYTLDAYGNTTAMEINAGALPTVSPAIKRLTQNAADELTAIQTKTNPGVQSWTEKSPAHDDEGNLTSDGDSTFAYDYENRLASVSSASLQETFFYAGDGTRMASQVIQGGTTNITVFVIDHTDPLRRPLAELDGNGALIRRFVWGRGAVAQVEANGTVHYFHHDGQGSTLALSDTNNVPTDQWFYSPYGEVMSRVGTTVTPYQWVGGMGVRHTASGLYFARHRYYHAGLKRWTARDPVGLAGGANLYAYARNPLLYGDPEGMALETVWDIASFGMGAYSLQDNVRKGKWGWAALDVVGLVYDGIAVAVPFLPAGASAGFKAARAGNTVIDAVNIGTDVARVADRTHDAARTVDTVLSAPAAGTRIHQRVADAVDGTLSSLDSTFMRGGANARTGRMPDLRGRGVWGDITTPREWGAHVRRYEDAFGEGIPILYERGRGIVNSTRLVAGGGAVAFGAQAVTESITGTTSGSSYSGFSGATSGHSGGLYK